MPQIARFSDYTFANALLGAMESAHRERLQEEQLNVQKAVATDNMKTNALEREHATAEEGRRTERHPLEMDQSRAATRNATLQGDSAEYQLGELRRTQGLRDKMAKADLGRAVSQGDLLRFQASNAPAAFALEAELGRGSLANQRASVGAQYAGIGAQYARIAEDRRQFDENMAEERDRYDDPTARLSRWIGNVAGIAGAQGALNDLTGSSGPRTFGYDYQEGTIPRGPAVRLWKTGPTPEQEQAIGDVFGHYRQEVSSLDRLSRRDALGQLADGWGFGLLNEMEQTAADIRAMRAGSDYRDEQLQALYDLVGQRLHNPQLRGLYQHRLTDIFGPDIAGAAE